MSIVSKIVSLVCMAVATYGSADDEIAKSSVILQSTSSDVNQIEERNSLAEALAQSKTYSSLVDGYSHYWRVGQHTEQLLTPPSYRYRMHRQSIGSSLFHRVLTIPRYAALSDAVEEKGWMACRDQARQHFKDLLSRVEQEAVLSSSHAVKSMLREPRPLSTILSASPDRADVLEAELSQRLTSGRLLMATFVCLAMENQDYSQVVEWLRDYTRITDRLERSGARLLQSRGLTVSQAPRTRQQELLGGVSQQPEFVVSVVGNCLQVGFDENLGEQLAEILQGDNIEQRNWFAGYTGKNRAIGKLVEDRGGARATFRTFDIDFRLGQVSRWQIARIALAILEARLDR